MREIDLALEASKLALVRRSSFQEVIGGQPSVFQMLDLG
jgi:hypothetical protein